MTNIISGIFIPLIVSGRSVVETKHLNSSNKRISQTRAGRVDKNVKFNICQEHV